MKFIIEALVPVTINCLEAPSFTLAKGDKKEFVTQSHFMPYSANINSAVGAGWVKVEILEEGKSDPKADKVAADAKVKAEKEAAEAKAAKDAAVEAEAKAAKEEAEAVEAEKEAAEAAAKAKPAKK